MSEEPYARRVINCEIPAREEAKIFAALEESVSTGNLNALRNRAFAYLLRDGVARPKAVLSLRIDEVVKDPTDERIQILREITQRPGATNKYQGRKFLISDRTRTALKEYLEVARSTGWLADPKRLEGPLWIAMELKGTQKQFTQRSAMAAWRTFLNRVHLPHEYQLDDLVHTGRIEFLKASRNDTKALAEHAGLSATWAIQYLDFLGKRHRSRPKDVMAKLNDQRKHKS